MTRAPYDRGRWARLPKLHGRGARRWRYFLDTLDLRISLARRDEPIDGRVERWQTFDPPLPRRAPLPRRPVRLRLMPASRNRRDAHGRFLPRERAS